MPPIDTMLGEPGLINRASSSRWRGLALFAAILLLASGVGGFWAGYRVRDLNFVARAPAALEKRVVLARAALGIDTQVVEWRDVVTNLHTLQYAAIRIGPDIGPGGAIAEVDGQIVVATPHGRFIRIDPDLRLGSLGITVPMGLDALRASSIIDDPLFAVSSFRIYDLLTVPRDGSQYDLYVSHSRFVSDDCFQFVVSRLRLAARPDLHAPDQEWSDVFVARPGCIRPKDRGWKFLGMAAGGRLAVLDARTLLVAIGDHQFDGFNDSWAAPQDPATDLGKIIAIDMITGGSRIIASGVRNPQGLLVTRDGRIFETEHGPQGGDEINLVREGGNYGWPVVTYGVNYGYPRRPWPSSTEQGQHDGYDRPAMAFVPSIAISNLVQPAPDEFPYWRDDLLVASLRANTLFRVRAEGRQLVYAEPIRFEGKRLRDIVALADGRIAILTDESVLLLLRNAERHTTESKAFTVKGLAGLPPPLPSEMRRTTDSPENKGREVYFLACASCHSLTGEMGAGPPLAGIVGRPIGKYPGFDYSPALAGSDGNWTEELLVSFITDPQRHFAGTTMPGITADWLEVPNIVAYLRTIRAPRK